MQLIVINNNTHCSVVPLTAYRLNIVSPKLASICLLATAVTEQALGFSQDKLLINVSILAHVLFIKLAFSLW